MGLELQKDKYKHTGLRGCLGYLPLASTLIQVETQGHTMTFKLSSLFSYLVFHSCPLYLCFSNTLTPSSRASVRVRPLLDPLPQISAWPAPSLPTGSCPSVTSSGSLLDPVFKSKMPVASPAPHISHPSFSFSLALVTDSSLISQLSLWGKKKRESRFVAFALLWQKQSPAMANLFQTITVMSLITRLGEICPSALLGRRRAPPLPSILPQQGHFTYLFPQGPWN